jgi:hypothetical protein
MNRVWKVQKSELFFLPIGAQSALGTELSTIFEKNKSTKKRFTKNGEHHLKEQDEIFSAV